MNRKARIAELEAVAPNAEFIRNFMQVPPMPRPIPAPKAKQARECGEAPEQRKPEVQI